MVTAPVPAKVIPKSRYGISVWVTVLLDKYAWYRPTYRLLEDLRSHGLGLSLGTLTGGLKKLQPLFAPIYDGIVACNQQEDYWHADETRWLMFLDPVLLGKNGHNWTLWVFGGSQSVVYLLEPTRDHTVPEKHWPDAEDGKTRIAVVDRTSTYKITKQVKAGKILLAFCWAHVRRDFLAVLVSWQEKHADWALCWVGRIAELYQRNNARVKVRDDAPAFAVQDALVREQVEHMARWRDQELQEPDLPRACRGPLESLKNHWSGLTIFVDHPEIPMDNNLAERLERGPVVGRKNFYGSRALWSGSLAAMLFSIFHTLDLWKLCPRKWLTAYLTACAEAGGRVPANAADFLPWNLSDERKKALAQLPKPAIVPDPHNTS